MKAVRTWRWPPLARVGANLASNLSVLRYCDSINDGTQLNKCATAAVLEQRGLGMDHVVPLKWI